MTERTEALAITGENPCVGEQLAKSLVEWFQTITTSLTRCLRRDDELELQSADIKNRLSAQPRRTEQPAVFISGKLDRKRKTTLENSSLRFQNKKQAKSHYHVEKSGDSYRKYNNYVNHDV